MTRRSRPTATRRSGRRQASLNEYRGKRDFGRTAEPRGAAGAARRPAAPSARYVIQKHHASREHFDLRLEIDGVMKSWAVPKGPSRDPSEKRLAVQVEDHPIEYNTFEGIIPEGEYGAGTVMIWDRGRYIPEGGTDAMRQGLEKGKVSFRLEGERLEGGWTLLRMRGRDSRQWLLVKQRDGQEVERDDLATQDVPSVASGRTMKRIATGGRPVRRGAGAGRAAGSAKSVRRATPRQTAKPAGLRGNGAGRRGMPTLTPMLATIGTDLPDESDAPWAFEPKYDGVRVLAFVTRGSVALVTRNGRQKAAQFPEIVEALERLHRKRRRPFVLDGEIVARTGRALGRFQALQRRIGEQDPATIQGHRENAPVVLVAFDLLLDGEQSLVHEPWTTRRTRLERLLSGTLPRGLRLGQAHVGNGARHLARARALGWEGLIAKRADSPYLPGVRSGDWQKLKIELRQEFVVGGWTEPRRTRPYLGALLLGYWVGDRLHYAGHMGGGFTRTALKEMRERLEPLEQAQPPFDEEPATNEPAHWVRPQVVVEAKFNEWTAEGRLRQPIFLGVRDDRNPRTVVRERISMQDDDRLTRRNGAREAGDRQGNTGGRRRSGGSRKRVGGMADLDGVFDALLEIEADGGDGTLEFGRRHELSVSSLDKFYFRDAQRTKGDLMRYYVRAAPWLLPLIADRPLALRRHPEGVLRPSFFQHAPPENTPPGVRVERVPTEDGLAPRLIGGDLITLLYCVQLGAIAVNPWHSRLGALETPDYAIIDLDPGPRTPFRTVVQVTRWLHEELEAAGIAAAVKTSGSRGLHIVIPLPRRTSDESALLLAQLFAKRVASAHRKEATTIRSRSKRSERAVYVDYMQNVVGKTVVAALSVRARPGATVSTPLDWAELTDDLDPTVFTIDTVPDELEERGRMFLEVLRGGNRLEQLLASA